MSTSPLDDGPGLATTADVSGYRRLALLLLLLPSLASAEEHRYVAGVQLLGGSGTHVENVDVGRHHELRAFLRVGRLQPVIWVSSTDTYLHDTVATLRLLGYGGGLGIVERHRGLRVELAGGIAHRSINSDCAITRGDVRAPCVTHRRWGPQVRFGVTAESSKRLGIFAAGFEVLVERVELQPGSSGVLVLAGIVLTGGLGGFGN